MKVTGIIAEYNPFHNGHQYHMAEAKIQTECDYCIVVLSGNFVQRGEPSVADKFTRARWALECGADLVLELPVLYAVGNAERFASGAVNTLHATGVVTDLCFGSEAGNIQQLSHAIDIHEAESPTFQSALHRHLQLGKSFPRAQYDALKDINAEPSVLDAFANPNNILCLEYLRQLKRIGVDITPHAIRRIGSYLDENINVDMPSASAIRAALPVDVNSALQHVPDTVQHNLAIYSTEWPALCDRIGALVLYSLRRMNTEEIKNLPDVQEGFENVLSTSAALARNYSELIDRIKSKRYTLARCKRILVSALLGITTDDIAQIANRSQADYIRVLGMRRASQPLLSEISRSKSAPLILRHADIKDLNPYALRSLSLDCFATDIYRQSHGISIPRDFSQPLILI